MDIRKATAADHPVLIDTLVQAFFKEEFGNWALQLQHLPHQKKLQRLSLYYALQLQTMAQPFNEVYCNQDQTAVALWIPPHQWDFNLKQQLALLPKLLRIVPPLHLYKVLKVIDLVQQHHPKAAHYYLQLIGVQPTFQGQGWSRKVLQPILQRADQEQLPCYLETATADNVALYRHYGFEVLYHLHDLPYAAPAIWGMWREP